MSHLGLVLMVLFTIPKQGISLAKTTGHDDGFVTVEGLNFVLKGSSFYINGFNAYWLMTMASLTSQRDKVTAAFQQAQGHGLTVARTWAFSDGTANKNMPLQIKPCVYDENMFQALDFVVSEAKKYGIKLILSLVNNYKDYGGKRQYVNWAKQKGQPLNSEDDFYTNNRTKEIYKHHVWAVLTRVNTLTGVAYKDEPAIMAWELMNEPRCRSDLSGQKLQAWIEEMASHVKSVDARHLLEVGLEGFYGQPSVERISFNPNADHVGTDYIKNSLVPAVDFTTVHSYPELWLPNSTNEAQMEFLNDWVSVHILDAQSTIKKPVLFSEFGKSSRVPGFATAQRDEMYRAIYGAVYNSSKSGGPAVGALFWQLFVEGMDSWGDGDEIVFSQSPSTAALIAEQSQRLQNLSRGLHARNDEKWKKTRATNTLHH